MVISLVLTSALPAFAQNEPAQTQEIKLPISTEEAAAVLKNVKKNNAILVDVRTLEEYEAGHLEFSKNIDFKSDNFKSLVSKLDRNKTIYLYCRSGNRSGKALEIVKTLGFKSTFNIGGLEDLQAKGLPVQP